MDSFWNICGTLLQQQLQSGLRWSPDASYEALNFMLERWRDRADPEPELGHISLRQSLIDRYERERHAREQEAQSEGSVEF
jgi:hypothetical protein